MSRHAREMRLVKTILSFEAARQKDGRSLSNGQLPRNQRRVLDSVIRQVLAMAPDLEEREVGPKRTGAVAPAQTLPAARKPSKDFPLAASLDARTHALRPMKLDKNDIPVYYQAFSFDEAWKGCEQIIRQLEAGGAIARRDGRLQGQWFLDALDEQGDILETYEITDSAVAHLRRCRLMRRLPKDRA